MAPKGTRKTQANHPRARGTLFRRGALLLATPASWEIDMDLYLTGKRALISGSSSGLGAECARRLAQEGCKVVVHGRDRDRAEQTAADIRKAGGEAAVT